MATPITTAGTSRRRRPAEGCRGLSLTRAPSAPVFAHGRLAAIAEIEAFHRPAGTMQAELLFPDHERLPGEPHLGLATHKPVQVSQSAGSTKRNAARDGIRYGFRAPEG